MGNGSAPTEQKVAASGVGELLGLVRRRHRLILCCASLTAGLGYVYAASQAPVYRATVELLVDPQALQVVGRDIVRPDTAASIDLANVDSQALVMTSAAVLRPVVERLDLVHDPAFAAHRSLLARLLGTPAPVLTAEQRGIEALDLLAAAITVQRVDESLVFRLAVSDPRPDRSAEIANAVASSYLRQVTQERIDVVDRANASVLSQIATLRGQLDRTEAAAERYRAEHGLLRSDTGLIVTQQLKDLYTQIDAANAELARLAARKEALARVGPEALLTDSVPEALSSPTVIALRAQYATTARDLASLSQTLLPQHPRMQEVGAELTETRKLLRDELARIRGSAASAYAQGVANVAALERRADALRQHKVDSSEAEIGLHQLESEADAVRAVFNATLARSRELEQQGKIATSNTHVLSDATSPLRPSKSATPIIVAAAALLGACLGLGWALLRDLRRRAARPRDEGGMTAREAAEIVGAGVAAPVAETGPARRRTARKDSGEGAYSVAQELQRLFGPGVPAVVAVASLGSDAYTLKACDALGAALADLGNEVLVCDPRKGLADMKVRRLAPRPSAESFVAAAHRIGGMGRQPASSATVELTEFIVAAWSPGAAGAMSSAVAHAIVMVVDLARTDAADLREGARLIDPSGRKIVALLDLPAEASNTASPAVRAAA